MLRWWTHQDDWAADASRFRIALKARQIGWTTVIARDSVADAVGLGQTTIISSASERQSREIMRRVRILLPLARVGFGYKVLRDTAEEIELSNGGRIISVPANPDTITGFPGNVILDEYSRHKHDHAIWEALFPSISARSDRRLSVVATPMGRRGKFYELVQDAEHNPASPWSLHKVDIHQAIASGCEHELDELRAGCADERVFAQSYLCEFVDEAYAWLPYELLLACVNQALPYELDVGALRKRPGDLYAGMDIGRKHDLTVIAVVEKVGERLVSRGFVELRNTPYDQQEELLYAVVALPKLRRACIDATGIGNQLAERAAGRYGHRVEPVTFTAGVRDDLAGRTRRVFEQRTIEIPDSRDLLDDLHSVEKTVTTSGNIRLQAPREQGSHADRYTALSLAVHAATQVATVLTEVRNIRPQRPQRRAGVW